MAILVQKFCGDLVRATKKNILFCSFPYTLEQISAVLGANLLNERVRPSSTFSVRHSSLRFSLTISCYRLFFEKGKMVRVIKVRTT